MGQGKKNDAKHNLRTNQVFICADKYFSLIPCIDIPAQASFTFYLGTLFPRLSPLVFWEPLMGTHFTFGLSLSPSNIGKMV